MTVPLLRFCCIAKHRKPTVRVGKTMAAVRCLSSIRARLSTYTAPLWSMIMHTVLHVSIYAQQLFR